MQQNPIERMITGIGLAVIGLVLTGAGYLWAATREGGGRYYWFWGLVFVGAIYALHGLAQMPGYLKSRRSPDPWVRAQYDPAELAHAVSAGIRAEDVTERRKAVSCLHILGAEQDVQVSQLRNFFLWGFVDADPMVRVRTMEALRLLAQHDEMKGRNALLEIQGGLREMREQGYEFDEALMTLWWRIYALLTNAQAFHRWRATGQLPEQGGAPVPPAPSLPPRG